MGIEDFSPSDLDAVLDIETRVFRQPWGRKSFLTELSCKDAIALVMRGGADNAQQTVIGYMCGRIIAAELYILKLAVRDDRRGCGVASRLLEKSLARAGERKAVSAVLDVRRSNKPAIALYRNHGFRPVGIRPNYYVDTGEDALVMRKNLKEGL